jgi:hypothetical protein
MIKHIVKKLPEYAFDFEQVKKDVLWILEKNNYIPQIGLTHSSAVKTDAEKILESTGSVFDYDSKEFKFKETDFTIFNEQYRHLYLYEVYKAIPDIGRFRIMTMNGPMCYTIHADLSKRYHYVIETNPRCLFLFPDFNEMIHIPQDKNLYIIDTRFNHTFVNGSRDRRIHLVMDDLSTLIKNPKNL